MIRLCRVFFLCLSNSRAGQGRLSAGMHFGPRKKNDKIIKRTRIIQSYQWTGLAPRVIVNFFCWNPSLFVDSIATSSYSAASSIFLLMSAENSLFTCIHIFYTFVTLYIRFLTVGRTLECFANMPFGTLVPVSLWNTSCDDLMNGSKRNKSGPPRRAWIWHVRKCRKLRISVVGNA